MGLRIGELYAVLTLQYQQFQQGLSGAGAMLRDFGNNMAMVGRSLTLVTAPLDAFGAGVIKAGMDFDTAMAKIQGLVGVSVEDLGKLKQAALNLAGETSRSPVELAEALYYLTSSGLDADKSIEVLEASAKAAASGLGTTQSVARAVAYALNAYGEEAYSAANITDILVAGVKDGTIEADQFADVLGRVIGVASTVGVGFESVVATIASLSVVGLDAHEAMTSLSSIFSNLLKPGAASKEILQAIGMSMEQLLNVARGPNGLVEVYRILNERLSDEQFSKVVPNVRALRGALNLLSQDTAKVDKVWQDVAGSTGDAKVAFEVVSKTAKFQLDQTMSDLQVTMLDFWEVIRGPVIDVLKSLQDVIKDVSEWFKNLDPGMQKVVIGFGALLIVLGPILIFVGMLAIALGGLVSVIGAVVGVLMGPVGVIIAIGAAIVILLDKLHLLDDVARALGNAWDAFLKAVQIVGVWIDVISKAIGGFIDLLHDMWNALNPEAAALDQAHEIFKRWTKDMDLTASEQQFIWNAIVQAWKDGRIHTQEEAQQMIINLHKAFQDGAIQLGDDGEYIAGEVTKNIGRMSDTTSEAVLGYVDLIKNTVNATIAQMGRLRTLFDAMPEGFQMTAEAAADFAKRTGISVDMVNTAWREYQVEMSKALTVVTTLAPGFEMTQAAAEELAIESGVSASMILDAWNRVKDGLSGLNDAASHALGDISVDAEKAWQTFNDAAVYSMDDVQARMAELKDRMAEIDATDFSGLGPDDLAKATAARKAMQAEYDSLAEFVASDGKKISAAAKATAETFVASADKMAGALKDLADKGSENWKKFMNQFKPKKNADPAKEIEKLQKKLHDLETVDLAKLGPAALAAWTSMYVSTKTKLQETQFFVDNKGNIIANLLPDAIDNSVNDNVDAWKKVFGVSKDYTGDIQKRTEDSSDKTAKALPAAIAKWNPELVSQLDHVKTKTTGAYDDTQTKVETSSKDAASALPDELTAKMRALGIALTILVRVVSTVFKALAFAAIGWGRDLAANWLSSIVRVLMFARSAVTAAARYALSGIESHSPPTYGPLRNISQWGENLADAFIVPFVHKMKDMTPLMRALQGSPLVALNVPTPSVMPYAAGSGRDMMSGRESVHYHEHYHVGTMIADDNGIAELTRRQQRVSRLRTRSRFNGMP
jgi:TP901 family phage tail tape measure protein